VNGKTNIVASVRDRLLNRVKADNVEFQHPRIGNLAAPGPPRGSDRLCPALLSQTLAASHRNNASSPGEPFSPYFS
jgi:hypothetical protein